MAHGGRDAQGQRITWMGKAHAETVTYRPRDGWVWRMNEVKNSKIKR